MTLKQRCEFEAQAGSFSTAVCPVLIWWSDLTLFFIRSSNSIEEIYRRLSILLDKVAEGNQLLKDVLVKLEDRVTNMPARSQEVKMISSPANSIEELDKFCKIDGAVSPTSSSIST